MTTTPIAILLILPTSVGCLSYRLLDDTTLQPLYTTRAFRTEAASRSGARSRVMLWARQHGYELRDVEGKVIAEVGEAARKVG